MSRLTLGRRSLSYVAKNAPRDFCGERLDVTEGVPSDGTFGIVDRLAGF